jgi:dihydropyrimidinase
MDLLLKGGTCVGAGGQYRADIGVVDGKITMIGQELHGPAGRTIDARGKLVMPGVIDAHVHLPWPSASLDSTDDFESGTTAAVCGGVTTIIEYVVPDLSGRIIPTLDQRVASAEGRSYADYSFHLIVRRVTDQTIADMEEAVGRGFTSFKLFTAYEGFRLGGDDMLRVLEAAKELGALVCFHAEDGLLISFATRRLARAGATTIDRYPDAHPLAADVAATNQVMAYAEYVGTRVHIVHVNTQRGAGMIEEARRRGLPVTGETCPHYLMFTDDVYRSGEPEAHYYVLAPAFRSAEDREGLWRALSEGDLQSIGTDHCPYTSEQKMSGQGDFRSVPGGASGVETSLPLLYTYGVRERGLSIERLVGLMATNPAKIFNLYPQKGHIAIGSDADLVIYDEEGVSAISSERLHSRTDHNLYEGMRVLGKPVMTILRGEVVSEGSKLATSQPVGRLIRRPRYHDLP